MVEREAASAKAVQESGLKVPAFEGIEEVDGRLGIVMEKITGELLGDLLLRYPWRLSRYAHILAETHAQIHSREVPGLPSFRDKLSQRIATSSVLPESTSTEVLELLERLPMADTVCHGDYYIDNIILNANGPVVIDWYGAGRGNPFADVARTWLLHRLAAWPFNFPRRLVIDPMRIMFHRAYLRTYLQLRPASADDIRVWLIPVIAARLSENVSGERERFVGMIDRLLHRSRLKLPR
ncbi:MAG: phosphotransferase [Spirochaetales bacterium]|nr:phosphotransferase [Spirochaetales bacterium]